MNFQFGSFSEFLQMAGHGPYVWGCYLITFTLLIFFALSPILRHRKFIRELERQRRMQAHSQSPHQPPNQQKPGQQQDTKMDSSSMQRSVTVT